MKYTAGQTLSRPGSPLRTDKNRPEAVQHLSQAPSAKGNRQPGNFWLLRFELRKQLLLGGDPIRGFIPVNAERSPPLSDKIST